MTEEHTRVTEEAELLLQRQDMLQNEAQTVVKELDLVRLLSQAGIAKVHGSSVLGLMTWRDIDISVSSPHLKVEHAYEVMMPLLTHPRVKQARYHNESGRFRLGELPEERYFFMVMYDYGSETDWKIDISFWLGEDVHAEPVYDMLEQKLTPETRVAILYIKDVWWQQPSYRQEVSSVDIYDAVLLHGIRTLDQFDQYLSERGKPTRIRPD